jgi:phosphate transport system substrate-binding protein
MSAAAGASSRARRQPRRKHLVTIASPKRIGALALMAAFAVAACGGGATPAPATEAPATAAPGSEAPATEPPAAGVSGSISVSGSSTVEPIATGVAELFRQANPEWNYTIEGPGTGDGFKRFCAGETDISNASRAIKDAEAEACKTAGIEYVELKIAFDGITMMTNPANEAISCLSFADMYAIVGPESTGFTKWSDGAAIAKELGSSTTLPEADLTIVGPGEESGTFDYFNEAVIQPIAKERGQVDADGAGLVVRPDYTSSANDNVIIEGITGSNTSFGWVGFAFAEENQDKIKELEVAKDANGTCVAPTPETIADGSYPISRPLFIYVNKAKAAENAAVAAYVDFYLAEGTIAKVLEAVPYVNLPTDELAATRAAWEAR